MDVAQERLILVDDRNRARGVGDKMTVHRQGLLHRAFSIFIVDSEGQLLMQRRQVAKYHSGGLWANACCGHPRVGETTRAAATRRLREELSLEASLKMGFKSRYSAAVGQDMHENELVYVYFGRLQGAPRPDAAEVDEIAYRSFDSVLAQCVSEPGVMAVWLRHYLVHHEMDLRRAIERTLS